MKKTSYSEEEVKKVFQTLYSEKKRVKTLQEKLQELGSERNTLRDALDKSEGQIAQFDSALATLREDYPELSLEDPLLGDKLARLQKKAAAQESAQPSTQLREAHEKIVNAMQKVVKALKAKYDAAQRESVEKEAEHQKAIASLTADFAELKQQLSASQAEAAGAAMQLRDLREGENKQRLDLEAKLELSDRQRTQLQSELEQLQLRLKTLHEQQTHDQTNQSVSHRDLLVHQQKIQQLGKENESLKCQLTQLQDSFSGSQEALENAKRDLANVYQKFNSELDHSKEEIQEIIDRNIVMEQELATIRTEATQKAAGQAQLREKYEAAQEQVQHQKLQVDKLLARVQERDQQIHKLQEFEYSYKKLSQQKLEVEEQLRAERKQTSALKESQQKLQQHLRSEQEGGSSRDQELRKLNEELGVARQHAVQLEEELQNSQVHTRQMQQEIQDVHTQKQAVETALTQAKEQQVQQDQLGRQRAQRLDALSRELDLIKQGLVRGVREGRELEERYLEAVNEKVAAVHLGHQQRQQLEELKSERILLQEQLSGLTQEGDSLHTRLEDLQQSINSQQALTANLKQQLGATENRLEDVIQERNCLEDELKLHLQAREDLGNTLAETQNELAMLQADRSSLTETVHELREGLGEREATIDELKQSIQGLQRDLEDAKQVESSREKLQEQYQDLKEEFGDLEGRLDDALEARMELEKQLEQLEELGQEQKNGLDERALQLQAADQARLELDRELQEVRQVLKDREGRLMTSQQHLGKKVKENAGLHEIVESQKFKLLESQNQMNALTGKISELTNAQALNAKQEQKLQEMLAETLKSHEAQVSKWEKKYFEEYELRQSLENQLKDQQKALEDLKTDHHKMQVLISNLGNYFNKPENGLPMPVIEAPTAEVAPDPLPQQLEFGQEIQGLSSSTTASSTGNVDLFGDSGASKPVPGQLFDA